MKKEFATIIFSMLCLITSQAQETGGMTIDTGRIDGAMYRIVIPENWNRNLVMYAHGYQMAWMNQDPARFFGAASDEGMAPFLDRGFAVAQSAYRKTGWAFAEGVEDTEALRRYFVSAYGKPDSCFITGHSMGGGITLATIENYPQHYSGAMPMCPLASRPYVLVKRTFEISMVFAALFPGVLPPIRDVLSGEAPSLSMPAILEAIRTDTLMAEAIAKRFELKPGDLGPVLMFNEAIIRDIGNQAGGSPFDNTNTLYSGFPDDWELNRRIERLTVTPGAEEFFAPYDRTGDLRKPTLLVHTIYDQLIPASMAVVAYDHMVQAEGRQSHLVVVYTNGQGHCVFTAEETGRALDLLRQWSASGRRPAAGILQ